MRPISNIIDSTVERDLICEKVANRIKNVTRMFVHLAVEFLFSEIGKLIGMLLSFEINCVATHLRCLQGCTIMNVINRNLGSCYVEGLIALHQTHRSNV